MIDNGIWHTHLVDINKICVHSNQHNLSMCGVITRAELESAAMRYGQTDQRTWIIIGDLWLTRDDIHNLLAEGWGTP